MPEYSYNGWVASRNPADFGGIEKLTVAGESFAPGVRAGDVHTVLGYVAEQLHARVEPVVKSEWHQADDWGYAYRPNTNKPDELSTHASGTSFDYNATRHVNGSKNTFTAVQVREIRKILREVSNTVKWGGDFTGIKDEMHFEVCANPAAVALVANRLRTAPVRPSGALMKLTDPVTRGDNVRALQARLNRDYPAYSKLVVDGVFGPATDRVVREFQRRSNLTVDGIAGPKTLAALRL